MQYINLTPHVIVVSTLGKVKSYQRSGTIIRVDQNYRTIGEADGFPVRANHKLDHYMPPVVPGITYIVSALVLMQVKHAGRTDCLAPDSNHANRDHDGNIISVPGWLG